MNWQAEVIQLIEIYFKGVGIRYNSKNDIHMCLIDFMNLKMKLIKPVPRIILKSDKLKSKSIPLKYIRALGYIENKIRIGKDITFHQSKKILDPSYNDLLLNDWIIQHIHLSDTKTQKGQKFYDRSKYLLFAAFNSNHAFFIDIREHDEQNVFAKREFLEIMNNNWPQVMKIYLEGDTIPFVNNYSDSEIDSLRRKGFTLGTTEINGKIFRNPGIGITKSGHNLHVIKRANEVVRYLHETMEEIENSEEDIKNDLSEEIGFLINDLELCLHLSDQWPFFSVYEMNSKIYISKKY